VAKLSSTGASTSAGKIENEKANCRITGYNVSVWVPACSLLLKAVQYKSATQECLIVILLPGNKKR